MLLKGTISLDDCDSSEVGRTLRHSITAAITSQFVLRCPRPFPQNGLQSVRSNTPIHQIAPLPKRGGQTLAPQVNQKEPCRPLAGRSHLPFTHLLPCVDGPDCHRVPWEFEQVPNLRVDGHEGRFLHTFKVSSSRSCSTQHAQWWINRDYYFAAVDGDELSSVCLHPQILSVCDVNRGPTKALLLVFAAQQVWKRASE
jgi:hypothetical protein